MHDGGHVVNDAQSFSSLLSSVQPWLAAVVLLSLRLAAVFLMTPLFHAMPLPGTVRVLLITGLAIILAAGFLPLAAPAHPVPELFDTAALVDAAVREVVLGATLGLGILLAFGTFSVAGRMIDIQIGYGMGQVLDPVSRQRIPVIASAFNQAGVSVFFFLDAHHALLRGMAYSIESFPVGMRFPLLPDAAPILKQAGVLFSLGFALAAPVAFAIFLVELSLGAAARNLPQVNMLAVGIPVKILIGLAALAMWFSGIGGTMTRVYGTITDTWEEMFSQARPTVIVPSSEERVRR